MNATQLTDTIEYKNFVFVEPEPTPEDLAQNGMSSKEEWFAARHAWLGTYEEQKIRAFLDKKEDDRRAQIQRDQGAEGEARLAEVERTEHEAKLAKRNAKRFREKESFQAEIRRKANALQPYIVGIQKWANLGARPVLVPDANTTIDDFKDHARAVKTYEKALAAIPQKATNLLTALNSLAGDMSSWYGDLATRDNTKPLADAIATLKAALPDSLPGEEVDLLRARIKKMWDAVTLYRGETFEIAPFILWFRPGQPVPYNYYLVEESSDLPARYENHSRKE